MPEDEEITSAAKSEQQSAETEAAPDVAAAKSDLAEFFGVTPDDEYEDDDSDDSTETDAETTPPATDAKPEGEAANTEEVKTGEEETPAEQPEVKHDEQGRVLDDNGTPLNEYGLPDISEDEWNEYLADESIPLAERLKDWQTYHNELGRRQGEHSNKLVEIRAEEITQTRAYVGDVFENGEEAYAELEVGAKKILDHVPAAMRNTPGYHEWAIKLAAVDILPTLIAKYGLKAVQQAAAEEAAATAAPAGKTKIRLAGNGTGNTPPPAPRASGAGGKGAATLSADEIAFCKSVDMTPEEYLANK